MKTDYLNPAKRAGKIQADNPPDAAPIIKALTAEANAILQGILGETLVPFSPGALGLFPYYWQNPADPDLFNATTYNWIQANLRAATNPVQLDQSFINYFIRALSCVVYKLSSADKVKLAKAKNNAINQQMAFLNAWKATFGSIPPPNPPLEPIDEILNTIATTWATPPVTLKEIQSSDNLQKLLNTAPASGQTLFPYLSAYLDALGDALHLEDVKSMNNSYVAKALAAARNPTAENGGIVTDNNNKIEPAYAVSTSLSDILNGLQSSSTVTIEMQISRTSKSQVTINIQGQPGFDMPIDDFFDLSVDSSFSYFSDTIATSDNKVAIKMDFSGVTLVNYGPVTFNMPTLQYWYWTEPIQDAINNGDQDVSGFKFDPAPGIDFSNNGPFGYLTGVAISNYPSITITVESSQFKSIETTIQQTTSVGLSFLGIPLGGGSESTYSHSASSNSSESTVTITLVPPPPNVGGNVEDGRGWVLGVQTLFPVAAT